MMQYLIIAGLIAFIYFFYFRKPQKISSKEKKRAQKEEANEMIECSQCGVYCELDDAILSGAKYYCSDECVALSQK